MTDESPRTRADWERDLRGFLDTRADQAVRDLPAPPVALTAAVRRVRQRRRRVLQTS